MAKYRFQCESCQVVIERYVPSTIETQLCPECGGLAKRLFPNIGMKKVTETVDHFLNVRHEDDQKKLLEDRRAEHYWEVEVPRFIQSGVYSVETMVAEGWVSYNERGEMVIAKGPPQKKK
jgi:Zn-finger nucleic acid-binding protein